MNLLKLNKLKIISIIFFFTVLILGILLFKDYGISLDERFHKTNASYWQKYAKSFIINRNSQIYINHDDVVKKLVDSGNDLTSSVPSIQPVPLGILYEFFVDSFDLKNSKEIYQYRHLFNFLVFFVGLLFFYFLIYKKYNSYFYALLGCTFLFLTPRLFSESFYNPQDIFFLSLTIINMYTGINFLKNPNFKNTILFSFSSALSIDTRIMGFISFLIILFFFFIKLLRSNPFLKANQKFIYYVFPITFIFIIIFWPYLWSDPLNNFVFAISKLSSSYFLVTNLYFGEYISSISVPWHYHIVWILITSPIMVIALFILGFLISLFRIFRRLLKIDNNLNDVWRGDNEMLDIYFLMMIIIPIYLFINKNIGYSGWRHLYFIYPSIIMLSLFGFHYLNFFLKSKKLNLIIYFFILFNISYLIYWNYKYHPYQYVYFNLIFKDKFNNNFDKDYWGLSNKNALEYILENNKNFPVKIATKSFASLEKSSLILEENLKNKLKIVYELENADFIITNYSKRISNDFEIGDNYIKYNEILVDGKPINTIYKKVK